MRLAVLGLHLTIVLTVPAPARALEAKQCLPLAEINAALRAEGQRTLVIGNRVAIVNDRSRASGSRADLWVNTFTANADGSLGYNLEGDRPMGEPSTRVCVGAKLTAIQLFDARRAGTPDAARRGGEFDRMLRADEERGTRPMLQATSVSTGPDGLIRYGLGITLMANVQRQAAWLIANYPGGERRDMFQMADTAFTEAGLARLP